MCRCLLHLNLEFVVLRGSLNEILAVFTFSSIEKNKNKKKLLEFENSFSFPKSVLVRAATLFDYVLH